MSLSHLCTRLLKHFRCRSSCCLQGRYKIWEAAQAAIKAVNGNLQIICMGWCLHLRKGNACPAIISCILSFRPRVQEDRYEVATSRREARGEAHLLSMKQGMMQAELGEESMLDWPAMNSTTEEPGTTEAAISQYLDPERRFLDLELSKVKAFVPQEMYTSIEG